MIAWLESLPLWLMGLIVVGGFILLTACGIYLMQRFYSGDKLWEHQHVAGFVHALIGITYAVLVGFVAVGVWQRFDVAEAMTFDEAGHWQVVYEDAMGVREGPQIRKMTREYLESVVKNEWPRMRSTRDSRDPQTTVLATRLHDTLVRINARTNSEQSAQQNMLSNASAASIERNMRTVAYDHGVNPAVWTVLFMGAFLTIGFTMLFGFRKRWLQYAMLCSMSTMIGGALFLTLALDFPFRGDVSISPEAYESAIQNFNAIDQAH